MPITDQGQIVWMDVKCSDGKYRHHPVIILTPTEEIVSAVEWVGVVCSHSGADIKPRPVHYIEIPYHPSRVCPSKLPKPTVAICNWLTPIERTSPPLYEEDGGYVPDGVFELVIAEVNKQFGDKSPVAVKAKQSEHPPKPSN